jgi:membrane dipeptidase
MEDRGVIRLIKSADDLKLHWTEWKAWSATNGLLGSTGSELSEPPVGVMLSMEGTDAMASPAYASRWYELGLRSAGIVHYGKSAHAVGTGQEGPLTEAGRKLLGEFHSLGMVLDVTHLSDQSFFEAVELFPGSLIASHQACRSLVPGQRQFSDDQLRVVIDRDGIVCVPCDAWMLYPDWIRGETKREVLRIGALADHIDHICQLAGNCDHAAIGSDLDGGYGIEQTPTGLDSIADLQKLNGILSERGYGEHDIAKIMGENAMRFFEKRLP